MASRAGSLLVISFVLSQLFCICLHAVPTTRISRLELDDASKNTPLANVDEMGMDLETMEDSRMVIEVNDYPGSGANNRHTPKPPQRCGGDC